MPRAFRRALCSLCALIMSVLSIATDSAPARAESCPWHCRVMSDGCNRCDCVNGTVTNCTLVACETTPMRRMRCSVPAEASYLRPGDCRWFGTAPFCNGSCPIGYYQALRDVSGDGKACRRGNKAYCCPQTRSQSPSQCFAYARNAIDQYARARRLRCGVSGPEWSGDFDHHYEWCRQLVSLETATAGQRAREAFLQSACGR